MWWMSSPLPLLLSLAALGFEGKRGSAGGSQGSWAGRGCLRVGNLLPSSSGKGELENRVEISGIGSAQCFFSSRSFEQLFQDMGPEEKFLLWWFLFTSEEALAPDMINTRVGNWIIFSTTKAPHQGCGICELHFL